MFVGSSAFTRNPNGTTRGDFALANEMGLHMVNTGLQNWAQNTTFTKVIEHRLVSHIPSGTLIWRMPLTSEEIPWGVSPSHPIHGNHYVWQVRTSDATVIANGDNSPLLATKSYGQGQFIYHGAMQPLIGHGGYDSGMYAYGIYRNVIEWAFESANLPIVKLSPWRYPYDAAFVVRHDFENDTELISSIEASAQFEASVGAKGDYYFTTGAIRIGSEDTQLSNAEKTQVIASLQRAVSLYGATIGSHNGGLKNPVNLSLQPGEYEYWHWGPDEALDTTPSGYANGKAYAYTSIQHLFSGYRRLAIRAGQWPLGLRDREQLPAHVGFAILQFDARRLVRHLATVGRHHHGRAKDRPLPALDALDSNGRQALCERHTTGQRLVHRHQRRPIAGIGITPLQRCRHWWTLTTISVH